MRLMFNLFGIIVSLFFFFYSEPLCHSGYDLSVNAVVVARAIFIIFALHCCNNIGACLDKEK